MRRYRPRYKSNWQLSGNGSRWCLCSSLTTLINGICISVRFDKVKECSSQYVTVETPVEGSSLGVFVTTGEKFAMNAKISLR